jgi:tRNA A37 threonylcarbamoyltransferase TsaD
MLPSPALCTDNAAMIAATAYRRLLADGPTELGAGADANLRLPGR